LSTSETGGQHQPLQSLGLPVYLYQTFMTEKQVAKSLNATMLNKILQRTLHKKLKKTIIINYTTVSMLQVHEGRVQIIQ